MTRFSQLLVLGGTALLLTACAPQSATPAITPTSPPEAAAPEVSPPTEKISMMKQDGITVTMNAQNDSGQAGTAVLQEVDGQVKVTINLPKLANDRQPAHIHIGACPSPGAVQYPLQEVVAGKSTTVIAVDAETLLSQLPLAVNVHKSATEASVYTSCGDL